MSKIIVKTLICYIYIKINNTGQSPSAMKKEKNLDSRQVINNRTRSSTIIYSKTRQILTGIPKLAQLG